MQLKGKEPKMKMTVCFRRSAKAKEDIDECEFYHTKDRLLEILTAILNKRTTSKRRKTASHGGGACAVL